MKLKITAIAIIALILLAGCGVNTAERDTPDIDTGTQVAADTLDSVPQDFEKAIGGDWDDLGAYRPIHSVMGKPFADLVGRDAYFELYLSRSEEEMENECIAVAYIKEFNVSKEDFERANEELRQIWISIGVDPEKSSAYELFPVDLIYSFDIDAINEYFLWENSPVEKERARGDIKRKSQIEIEE